jgi:hypothetical protein
LRPSIERVGAFAHFRLNELGDDCRSFRVGNLAMASAGFDAEPDRGWRCVETRM